MTWKEFINTKKTVRDGGLLDGVHKRSLGFFTPEGTYIGTCISHDIKNGSFTAAFRVGRQIYRDKASFKVAIAPITTVNWRCLDKIINKIYKDKSYWDDLSSLSNDEKEVCKQFFGNLMDELYMRRFAIRANLPSIY